MLSLFPASTQVPALTKLLLFFLVWMVVWLPLAAILAVVLKWNPLQPSATANHKIPLVVSLYAVAPVAIWVVSGFKRAFWTTYGLGQPSTLVSFGVGAVIGTVGLGGLFFLQQQFGWVKLGRSDAMVSTDLPIEPEDLTEIGAVQSESLALVAIVGLGLWVSTIEELVFRGFLWNQLQQDYAPWVAATSVSVLFAMLHWVWDGRKILPQLPGLWLMGMVLSLARWADQGQLGLAIGLHAGWIWTLASCDRWHLVHYSNQTAKWLTGFDNHPLAGVMGLGFLLLTGIGLWTAAYR
ncbi:CPBP family intramembrane glutamic endopeptidase [Thermocoleostomius sinensis]|uniref:Type II CAAX endopeptidase family protein n=1 Tax=Thermocoleostomius sinensis A174 TaxID=2016057 RepID=A0A9E8Z9L4_9CYAN|nr:type II CAAX endopeptidase family protein [Thermocoleostomius sinensis]WAL59079.1 type II CAAX endopeptidase family protein [Thermocoleostomius sinensis A174]